MSEQVAGQTAESNAITEALAPLLTDGFKPYEHERFKPGTRVRNAGQQYARARQFGTAEVVLVLRKEGSWERRYGRLNLEVLIRRDEDGHLGWWQDYRTALTEGCWFCDGDSRDLCPQHTDPATPPVHAEVSRG